MLSFIEHPPRFFRRFFPYAFWYCPQSQKTVYLTFDDGPIPEVTPFVLDLLDKYHIKATFFMVGDNVRKHPDVFQQSSRTACRRHWCLNTRLCSGMW
jgi:peptidoglycan/xylan/chitin deacetylase (PgdA/CDA1 family)